MNAVPRRAGASPPQPSPQGRKGVLQPTSHSAALAASTHAGGQAEQAAVAHSAVLTAPPCGGGREAQAPHVGIAGAGLAGRLLAWRLLRAGMRVSLFDAHARTDRSSAGPTAAAMLSPTAELAAADAQIHALGVASLGIWPQWLAELHAQTGREVYFRREGTLVVAHAADAGALDHYAALLRAHLPAGSAAAQPLARASRAGPSPDTPIAPAGPAARPQSAANLPGGLPPAESSVRQAEAAMQPVDGAHIAALEPLLAGRFARGLLLPQEGQLANDQLYAALAAALDAGLAACGGAWHEGLAIEQVQAAALVDAHGTRHGFDLAVDCRGVGSRGEWPGLHGVRGEVLTVFAPGISLRRPVRLIHPRYAIYVAPRPGSQFIVGATELDSEDAGPPTLRSTLELGSALYSLHPEFGEARVLRLAAALRPALPDHRPVAGQGADGVWRINGLFRHGYLIAPALVRQVAADIVAAFAAARAAPPGAATQGASRASSNLQPPIQTQPQAA